MRGQRRKLELRQDAVRYDSEMNEDNLLLTPNELRAAERREYSTEDDALNCNYTVDSILSQPLSHRKANFRQIGGEQNYSGMDSTSLTLPVELNSPKMKACGAHQHNDRDVASSSNHGAMRQDSSYILMSELEQRLAGGSPRNGAIRNFADVQSNVFSEKCVVRPVSSYFLDGKRRIDFVLVYESDNKDRKESPSNNHSYGKNDRSGSPQKHCEKRQIFESNLRRLGLELEYASAVHSNTQFVLIHAPFHVLLKQAELMNIKMPVHQNDIKKQANLMDGALNAFLRRFRFLDFDERIKRRIEPVDYFTQPFIEQHLECFVNYENEDDFFSNSDRSRMVYDFLIRTRYDSGEKEKFRFGIDRLVQAQTYTAAYPLHDDINYAERHVNFETCTNRELLYETWVRAKNICKYQPLHLIKEYFGTKIGFYFAWLGYYTRFLYVISILGIMCFFYGFFTKADDIPSNDVCGDDGIGAQVLLCPVCEKYCDYTRLSNSCNYSKITYIFDNCATVLFAVVVSVWTTLFLEFWKRYHAELAYKWNVLDFEMEQEVMRPEFQYLKGSYRTNPVTQQKEPFISFKTRALRLFASCVVVVFFMLLVVALVFGIVVYRIILMHVFYTMEDENETIFQTQAVLITSGTAAVINLIFILIMNYIYDILALKLTELECHRTQTEFDNSYTLKVFLFQFVNFYSSLFYIAFIKGRFSGVPAYTLTEGEATGVRIFGQRLEDCDPAGCMVELVIQLCIIMVGKQIFNAFAEIGYPVLDHWFRRWRLRLPSSNTTLKNSGSSSADRLGKLEAQRQSRRFATDGVTPLYERDYSLSPVSQQFLFNEYLEMVLQFGFITLFVAAFPLAPFFALLNNILEIRLDAYKFVVTTRRPIPAQAKNIGVWMTILDLLSNVAVLCNAFVIAFTSDFIPKLYYRFTHGGVMYGYVNDSLSYFDTTGISPRSSAFPNVTMCRYKDYRKPPCELHLFDSHGECSIDGGYEFQDKWWIILTMRLVFVLVFELFVLSIKAIFAYIIPDMPSKIVIQLQREKYLSRQAILQRSDTSSSTRFSSPQGDRVECTDNLKRSNDAGDVAFQPDEDLVGDDNVDVQKQQRRRERTDAEKNDGKSAQVERDNLRRIFVNRRRPSLSPCQARRAATISTGMANINFFKDTSPVASADSPFTSNSSLSPDAAWDIASSAAAMAAAAKRQLAARSPQEQQDTSTKNFGNKEDVGTNVMKPENATELGLCEKTGCAANVDTSANSSMESFHTASEKNSPKNILKKL